MTAAGPVLAGAVFIVAEEQVLANGPLQLVEELVVALITLFIIGRLADGLENVERRHGGLVGAHKDAFVFGAGVERLVNEKLRRVVVPVQLPEVAMLVAEHAPLAVHALLGLVEGPAVLALELLLVGSARELLKLLLAVGEPALLLKAAVGGLKPVAADLGLVLAVLVDAHHHQVRADLAQAVWKRHERLRLLGSKRQGAHLGESLSGGSEFRGRGRELRGTECELAERAARSFRNELGIGPAEFNSEGIATI